jgi:single-strand DNA-binding protein
MNVVTLTGHLGQDPELKTTTSGKSVCSVSLAVRDDYDREKTHWLRLVLWNKQADTAATYLRKGSRIGVTGRLSVRDYTDKDGKKRNAVEVVVDRFEFLDKKTDSERSPSYDYKGTDDFEDIGGDDDLPF